MAQHHAHVGMVRIGQPEESNLRLIGFSKRKHVKVTESIGSVGVHFFDLNWMFFMERSRSG